jgi:hypothetical protein
MPDRPATFHNAERFLLGVAVSSWWKGRMLKPATVS